MLVLHMKWDFIPLPQSKNKETEMKEEQGCGWKCRSYEVSNQFFKKSV